MLAYLLLGVAHLSGLLMLPYGAPGVWLQLGALGLFGWATGFDPIGVIPLAVLFGLAVAAELVDPTLTRGHASRELRRRCGFGGLAGGTMGAVVGLLLPLLGSMFGAFAGCLTGALFAGFTARPLPIAWSGWAALGGQALTMAMRTAAGVAIAAFTLLSLTR